MVNYEPMALRSSSSTSNSSSTCMDSTAIMIATRSITTRRTNKSSSSSSQLPPLGLTSSTSSSSSKVTVNNASIHLSPSTTTTTTTLNHLYPMENDNTSVSNSSNLKRRRGRPSKKSAISSLSSAPSTHKKLHIATLEHGLEIQHTTSKLDRLKLKKSSSGIASPPREAVSLDTLRMGQQIDAWKQDQGDYYRARVVEITSPLIFVHYEGFPPDQADWIDKSNVRTLENSKHTKTQRQRISKQDKSIPLATRREGSAIDREQQPIDEDYDMNGTMDEQNDDDDRMAGGGNYGPRGKESQLSWQDYATFYYTQDGAMARQHTGLIQDRRMTYHCCPCHSKDVVHPERPDRLSSILQQLHNDRILRYVKHLHGREATTLELAKAHSTNHIRNYTPHTIKQEEEEEKTIKITSIAALLNPIVSPPNSPTTEDKATLAGPLRGIGGGVVVDTNQGHAIRHRKHLLATTPSDKAQSDSCDPKAVYPPDLVCQMTCGELGISVDTTFHPLYSSLSAKVAAGSLISLVDSIVQGQLKNGFALIRPPGHHAEESTTMGFCFFNNVAVAALATLDKYPGKIKKILIIDWDVHHGNGTQKIFYDNPNVLYISIHRWDQGSFYPYSGAPEECGVGEGLGKNINIALSDQEQQSRPMGDPEFVAAFYHLIVPIARQFGPDMIFVSAGFDAAEGHPDNLGGYQVTPRGYAILTKMVMDLAEELCEGRLVLTLEGGYALQPLAISAAASVTQLLPAWTTTDYLHDYRRTLNSVKPNQACVDSLTRCVQIQQTYWHLPPPGRFQLPLDWRAKEGILTRPKREKRPIKIPIVEGY
ncbi:hypothetical protein BC941DRAFT_437294 [Chlamydoabsidia padenii]|nr:hypothetical protein BC941DRAFT_437294 [Chlamydoabsidia padenii]